MYYIALDPTFSPHPSSEGQFRYCSLPENTNGKTTCPVWHKLDNAIDYLKNNFDDETFGVVPASDEFMKRKMEQFKFEIKFMDNEF